jgi:tetratricopeptide (TPR) repeat protein
MFVKLYFLLIILFTSNILLSQNIDTDSKFNGNYLVRLAQLNKQPDGFAKFQELGKIYQQTGNYNKAIASYNKALSYDTILKIQRDLAKCYEANGNKGKALKVYQNIVKEDSLGYLDLYKLGRLYAKLEQKKEALSIFKKLEKIDMTNPNYPYQIALNTDDIYRKANAFLRAYKADSLHAKSIYQLALFFKMIHDKDSSKLFLEKGLQVRPNSPAFLKLKIADLYKKKAFQEVLRYAKKLDTIVRNDIFAKQRIGLSYWKLKEYDSAKAYLKKAIKIDRAEKTSYYYLGLVYKDLKEYEAAKMYFYLAIFKDKPNVDNEYYNLGIIAQEEKKPKEAIKNFKKAFENNDRNYKALFELAVMSDLYYKDKEIGYKYYEKYIDRFENKNPENTKYAIKRMKELKEKAFFEK